MALSATGFEIEAEMVVRAMQAGFADRRGSESGTASPRRQVEPPLGSRQHQKCCAPLFATTALDSADAWCSRSETLVLQ